MKSKLGLTLIGFVFFIIFLIVYLPAKQVIYRVALPNNVAISDVSGTLWKGSARRVSVNGLAINNVTWKLSALPLLWGQASLTLDAGSQRQANDISFSGDVSISLTQPMTFTSDDFVLYLPTDQVLANVSLPLPVEAGGRFRVTLSELDFEQTCQVLDGTGEWLNASVQGTQGTIPLGVFSAQLGCDNRAITVAVAEPNVFGLNLNARVASMRDISVEGKFKPDASLPQEVHDAAKFFGQADSQGYIAFKL
ncbi:type II secretion system protein N [Alteromonas facilis]|uniref:type II secretion system protein N n=1 Tax=Alteromonas facilis TaxID=2048004 RepID=UPI000C288879|nr:type II secretion system protein N [Alteromonas facilis]